MAITHSAIYKNLETDKSPLKMVFDDFFQSFYKSHVQIVNLESQSYCRTFISGMFGKK